MPNHCRNYLDVTGPEKDIRRFAKAAEGLKDDSEALDLGRFIPEPKELANILSGSCEIKGKRYSAWRRIPKPDGTHEEVGIEPWEERSFKKRFGATNLYDWHCNTYGTKWGVYDVSVESQAGHIRYVFNTAWCPFSDNVLGVMAKKFPSLNFTLKYGESGSGFFGYCHAEGGDVTETEQWDTSGKWKEGVPGKECDNCGDDECYGHYDPNMFPDPVYVELLESSG